MWPPVRRARRSGPRTAPHRPWRPWLALVLVLPACGLLAGPDDRSGWPIDPDSVTDPARMTVEPVRAAPGDLVAIRFPGGFDRGILYAIDANFDGRWERRGLLISDADRREPQWFPLDAELGVEMVGIGGEGPDRVIVPDVLDTGQYRICTANAVEALCVPLDVVAP